MKIFCLMLVLFCCSALFVFAEEPAVDINAVAVYQKAASLLTGIPEKFRDKTQEIVEKGWIGDNNDIKELLAKNQPALREFKKGTTLGKCEFAIDRLRPSPYCPTADDKKPPLFSTDLIRLIILEARLYQKENKQDLALEDYISLFNLSRQLTQQKELFPALIRLIVEGELYFPLRDLIANKSLDSKTLHFLLNNFVALQKSEIGFKPAIEREREMTKHDLRLSGEEAKAKGQYRDEFYQELYKEFDLLCDEYFGYFITAFETNHPELYTEKYLRFKIGLKDSADEEAKEQSKSISSSSDFFKKLVEMVLKKPYALSSSFNAKIEMLKAMPLFEGTITTYYITQTKLNILMIAAAINLYAAEEKKEISDINVLIPTYLTEIPKDPFDDFKPLKYEKIAKGWTIYSAGKNNAQLNDTQKAGLSFSLLQ